MRAAEADIGFIVELDRFEGPLDLLLHLVREQDIDIFDIPIARVTGQFLRAIEGLESPGLDRAGEFLEMAATLMRIKSQMLLPRQAVADGMEEDPRADLVRRLLEYEYFREVARRLERAEADRGRHFARGHVPPRPEPDPADHLELDWDDLLAVALALDERTREPEEHRVVRRAVPLREKITLVREAVARLARVEFEELVAPFADRLHSVVTLLAALELAKRRDLALRQREPFAPIWLYRRETRDGAVTDGDDADR